MCPRSKAALSRRSRTAWGAADCISRASSPGAIIVSAHLAFAAGTAQAGKDAMPFPEALRALNHRDFRFFWGGQLVSLIGTWMQSVAQSWLVLQLSGSPLKLGLIGTFQFAPVLMFSVVAGAIVDRLPKRRLILATQSAREGLRYALGTSRIALVLGLVLVVSLCVFNFTIVVPLVARKVLGLGAEGFGFLMAALGIGAVTGALSLATLGGRQTPLRTILLAGVLSCLALVALATAADFHTAVVHLFQLGFFSIVFMASCNTTLQLSAPDALRGRVMSFYTLAFGGAFPLGAFMIGAIAEALGVRTALVVAGSAGLVGMRSEERS